MSNDFRDEMDRSTSEEEANKNFIFLKSLETMEVDDKPITSKEQEEAEMLVMNQIGEWTITPLGHLYPNCHYQVEVYVTRFTINITCKALGCKSEISYQSGLPHTIKEMEQDE